MNRREFIASAASMAGLGVAQSKSLPNARRRQAPLFYNFRTLRYVGISSWSFRGFFASTSHQSLSNPSLMITLLDFPRIISDRYQVHHLEVSSLHFPSTSAAYMMQLRRAASRAGSRLVNIEVRSPQPETGGGLSDRDPSIRGRAVATVKNWIDAARAAGAPSVSTDLGLMNPADLSPALASCRELSNYGRLRRVSVLLENQRRSDPRLIATIVRQTPGRTLGALPDLSAFSNPATRVAGLDALFPEARGLCHADGVAFDAQGNETTYDFKLCLAIAKRYRFRGIYSVKFEGAGDPYQGVQNVVNELVRYL